MAANDKTGAFKKHLILLGVIAAVIIPVLNNFALSLILSFIDGDVMLAGVSAVLKTFVSALSILDLFLMYAVLINSVLRFGFKGSSKLFGLSVLRVVLVYAAYLSIGAIVTMNFSDVIKGNIYYCLTNAFIDILLLAGAMVLTVYLRSKYIEAKNTNITVRRFFDFNNPLMVISAWVTVLISAFLLSGCIINTVSDISAYGASNLNFNEVVYLVSPYAKWLAKTAIGYCVFWCCAKWLDTVWKNLHKPMSK